MLQSGKSAQGDYYAPRRTLASGVAGEIQDHSNTAPLGRFYKSIAVSSRAHHTSNSTSMSAKLEPVNSSTRAIR